MQDVDAFLMMKSYNLITAALLGIYILVRWPITGQTPIDMIWSQESAIMLFSSAIAHIAAQMNAFYVNQKA